MCIVRVTCSRTRENLCFSKQVIRVLKFYKIDGLQNAHHLCPWFFIGPWWVIRNLRQTYENDHVAKKRRFFRILDFKNLEIFFNFIKYLFPWKLYTRWLSLLFHKVHGFRDLENLIHPSWRSLRSDLIGDSFCWKPPKLDKNAIPVVWEVWAENFSPPLQPH